MYAQGRGCACVRTRRYYPGVSKSYGARWHRCIRLLCTLIRSQAKASMAEMKDDETDLLEPFIALMSKRCVSCTAGDIGNKLKDLGK